MGKAQRIRRVWWALCRLARRIRGRRGEGVARTGAEYWRDRAEEYGARAVLDVRHTEAESAAVTAMQKARLFPFLRRELQGDEKLVLDFGCGVGRFTPDLATLIGGRAIGLDTVHAFLDLAPRGPNVDYCRTDGRSFPVAGGSVDVLWICLVMGGIVGTDLLPDTLRELQRVLRPGGLVMLIENTTEQADLAHWKYRPVSEWQRLFAFAGLRHAGDYADLDQRISILIGRSKPSPDG